MKVTGLILVTLGLVAIAQANKHYNLRCAQEEMGIRWPSYVSHSEYYVCPRVGGKQMTITCNPGEVFTFVLQMCTGPSQYIPAPAVEQLPTADPIKPAHHFDNSYVDHPPIVSEMGPHIFDIPLMKPQQPPVMTVDAYKPPVELTPEHNHEEHKTEEELVKPAKPMAKPMPPMPPTPAPTPPTPPMVDPVTSSSAKKPLVSISKKPTADKKKTSGGKPVKTEKKKPTSKKDAKKTPQNPKKPSPAKKSPKAPAKKSPKTPTKA